MNSILDYVLYNFGLLLKDILNFVTYPILNIVRGFIPNFSNYFAIVNDFVSVYVVRGAQFFKMMFLHLSNVSIYVFDLFVISVFLVLYLTIVMLVFRFIYNIYQTLRGSKEV